MSLASLRSLLVSHNVQLRAALQSIDANALGVCFIVDDHQRLVGILTDGDVRRAMIAGASVDDPVSGVMRREFVALPVTTPSDVILRNLSASIRVIPLVAEDNRVVDFASIHGAHRIPLIEPVLLGNELTYVTDCLKTNWVSSQGAYVRRFEQMFQTLLNTAGALAVSNGTTALHLALLAIGIRPGDEVIVPDLTFAASINSVLHAGATPVLVDVNPKTWTIDIDSLVSAINPRTRAIMPVHLYGHPCDMDPILEVAARHGIKVVEDCAESLGSRYKGSHTGVFGNAAAFSFFGNKTITTGEGGMVVFREKDDLARAALLRDHGMTPGRRYWHEIVGYNYRMTNIQAAIGVAQMERLDDIVQRKMKVAARYSAGLREIPGIVLPPSEDWATNSHWLYTVQFASEQERAKVADHLLVHGIETRRVFHPLHEMPIYREFGHKRSFDSSGRISQLGLSLPSTPSLTEREIDDIVNAIWVALGLRAIHPTDTQDMGAAHS